MNIAIVMYDKINLISLASAIGYFKDLPNARLKTCAFKREIVDEYGLKIQPEVFAESIYGANLLVIPDGIGAISLRYDEIFLSWIKSAKATDMKIGLDLGSLIFGGAGFLKDKKATIRGGYKNALSEYCEVCDDKFCQSGDIISISNFNDEAKNTLNQILNKNS